MRKTTRQEGILDQVARDGRVVVEALAERFGVSGMTIRRDLAELAEAGKLNRVHGGALAARAGLVEFLFQERASAMAAEKKAIGRRVAEMVQPGMSVSLDTGTTTLEVARALVSKKNIRVLTTSLAIASVLHASEGVEVILLGGIVRKTSPDLWGPMTEENINKFRVQYAILGTDAVTPSGLYTTDVSISRISRALIDNARESVVVADSSKFFRTAFVQHGSLSEITRLVTDEGCPPNAREWLEKSVKEVVYVPVEKR